MNKRPKVWVTQEISKFNYLDAEAYGDIEFFTSRDYSPVMGSMANADMLNVVRQKAEEFDPREDYIITTGSPVVMMLVMAVLARRHSVRKFNILKWDNRVMKYVPIVLEV